MPDTGLTPLRVHINPTTNVSDCFSITDISRIALGVVFPVGSSAGAYVIETSPEKDFAGTWQQMPDTAVAFGSANTVVFSDSVDIVGSFARVRQTTPGVPAPSLIVGNNNAATPRVYVYLNTEFC